MVKNPLVNAGDVRDSGLIPESERSPGGEHGNPLQYSCLENSMDGEAWWATVHRVTKSRTRQSDFTTSRMQHFLLKGSKHALVTLIALKNPAVREKFNLFNCFPI